MPKIVDRDAMRAGILEAAMAVFRRAGYHAAKMTDIARQAGLAKGTLYLYFNSKEELTVALVERYFAEARQAAEAAPAPDGLDAFLEGVGMALRMTGDYTENLRLFIEVFGPSFASDKVRAAASGFFDHLSTQYAQDLSRLAESGQVAPVDDTAASARALTAMLDGLILHRALFNLPPDRFEPMINETLALLRGGLAPKRESN
ncbi:MAG: TetR/AcrR family transcriptional regulator [Brevirhabdus sp.]